MDKRFIRAVPPRVLISKLHKQAVNRSARLLRLIDEATNMLNL